MSQHYLWEYPGILRGGGGYYPIKFRVFQSNQCVQNKSNVTISNWLMQMRNMSVQQTLKNSIDCDFVCESIAQSV